MRIPLLFLLLLLTYSLSAQGTLDPAFDEDGLVLTNLGADDYVRKVLVRDDGRVVAIVESGAGSQNDLVLVQYNTDGSLDASFGNNGIAEIDLPEASVRIGEAILLEDGDIMVSGGNGFLSSSVEPFLARINSDGSLDAGFGNGGIVIDNTFGVPPARINALALQNGNQLIAGINAPGGIFVVRYNVATGDRDNTFGTNGLALFDAFPTASIEKILIQEDEKILMVGTRFEAPDFTGVLKVRRFNIDGDGDLSYGDGSSSEITVFAGGSRGVDATLLMDGGMLVVVNEDGLINRRAALTRIGTNGFQDLDFGSSGLVIFESTSGLDNADIQVHAMSPLQNGAVLVAGTDGGPSASVAFLRRFSASGSPDLDFGQNGAVTTDFGAGMGFHNGSSIALSGSDKVVIGGFTFDGSEVDMGLAQYSSGGMVSIESIDTIVEDWKITPNPISNQAEIQGFLNQAGVFDLRVFDQKGALVQTLWTGHYLAAGHFSQLLDFSNLSSGVYFIQLEGKMGQSLQTLVKK